MRDLFNRLALPENQQAAEKQREALRPYNQQCAITDTIQPRPSEVEQQMARLDAIIDSLSKQCGELLNRLDPVLRRQNGVSQPETEGKQVETIVPLAARIRTSADSLGSISSAIEHIINSIEL